MLVTFDRMRTAYSKVSRSTDLGQQMPISTAMNGDLIDLGRGV